MLARFENTYLNILRVAFLVVAGLALLLTVAALVSGLGYFAKQVVTASTAAPQGGDLAGFVAEKKLTLGSEPEGQTDSESNPKTAETEEQALSPALDRAATGIAAYLNAQKKKATIKKTDMVKGLNELRNEVPFEHADAYDQSLGKVVDQLAASKGKPLNEQQVGELLIWHQQRFQASVATLAETASSDQAAAWDWIVTGSKAFLVFAGIAFFFLLVRMERHLRVVRVMHEDKVTTAQGSDWTPQDAEAGGEASENYDGERS